MKNLLISGLVAASIYNFCETRTSHHILFTDNFLKEISAFQFTLVGNTELTFTVEVIEDNKINVYNSNRKKTVLLVTPEKGSQYLKIYFPCPKYLQVIGIDGDLEGQSAETEIVHANEECNFHTWKIDVITKIIDEEEVKELVVDLVGHD